MDAGCWPDQAGQDAADEDGVAGPASVPATRAGAVMPRIRRAIRRRPRMRPGPSRLLPRRPPDAAWLVQHAGRDCNHAEATLESQLTAAAMVGLPAHQPVLSCEPGVSYQPRRSTGQTSTTSSPEMTCTRSW